MESPHIYQRIVDSIRQDIMSGKLKPGSRLPAIRTMKEKWQCNTGTVQHAYQELARMGLVTSHVGQGTKVVEHLPEQEHLPLRRAMLYNRTEAFLLEIMTAGYGAEEVEQSMKIAMDRWRIVSAHPEVSQQQVLRFIGSHDPAMALVAAHYHEVTLGYTIQLSFTGGLGGIIALGENKADLAGAHLWDETTNTYNESFVRRLLPGRKVALLTLAQRHVGLVLAPGNPRGVSNLNDLNRNEVRFVNRQPGSGIRVWLDAQLDQAGIKSSSIRGYDDERMSHSEVALEVSKGHADAGLVVETAALSFGLDFKQLTTERYDLIIPAEKWEMESVKLLTNWLTTSQAKAAIFNLGGYDIFETGTVRWVD